MVFGALLGGLVNRAGERSYEAMKRQQETEDWQRSQNLQMQSNFLSHNWENLLPEQQEAMLGSIAPLIGMKGKDLSGMVGGARAIHSILPAMPAPTGFGGVQTTPMAPEPAMGVGATDVTAPPIGQVPIAAKSPLPNVAMGQQPAQAIAGPSQTPAEIIEQRKFDMNQRLIDQKIARIKGMGLDPKYARMAELQAQGINIIPYETGLQRNQTQKDIAEAKMGQIYGRPTIYQRGNEYISVWGTGEGAVQHDPAGNLIPYQPQPGDKPVQTEGRPPQPPQTQLTQITGPQGTDIVEYQPIRAGQTRPPGQAPYTVLQRGAVKGTVPPLDVGTREKIEGLGMVAQNLGELQQTIPQIAMGPVWGNLRNVQFKYLGGWGTTPEEVQVASRINQLLLQAFEVAGANFTTNEQRIFRSLYPAQEDTMETAMGKIGPMLKYVQETMAIKQGLLTPAQKMQLQMPNVGVGGKSPQETAAAPAAAAGGGAGYGPRQQFRHNGELKWGRRNLSTGKVQLER